MLHELIQAASRALLRAYLRLRILELATWLDTLSRDGITDSLYLREVRGQLREFEIRLALLHPPLTRTQQ